MMRFETNAGRIRRGVPIFITFSPDEKHNVLMLRLHRSRANDPIHKLDKKNKQFGTRAMPNMDEDYVGMEVSKPPGGFRTNKKENGLCARGLSVAGCL